MISLAGSQGSGKSTMVKLLADILNNCFSLSVAVLSLDDFYLGRAKRLELAESVHPLLATRGVPGTHDIRWMQDVIAALIRSEVVQAPVFDKATDDRLPDTRSMGPVDVILCEGWCWGAKPTAENDLQTPVNPLEADEDTAGIWRNYVNNQLEEYQSVFQTDYSIFLAVPGMQAVLDWIRSQS